MKFAKVIGRVVSTVKVDSFEGLKLLLIQPLDEKLDTTGDAIIAVDTIRCGTGDIVYYETSKEAAMLIENVMNPCDAAIMAIIDKINLE
jgi:ethanolamine utilization protein EutN